MDKGWIKLHRTIDEHWIWKDAVKLKWWIDLLLIANHDDKKVNIGMQLFDCKRGQTVMSLMTLAKRWKVSKHVVNNFLTLLKTDNMIATENLTKTTRITICNYDSYQDVQNDTGTQRERNGTQTRIKELKNIDNTIILDSNKTIDSTSYSTCGDLKKITTEQREKLFYDSLTPYVGVYPREMIRSFYNYWSEWNKSGKKMRWELEKTWQIEKRLEYWNRRSNSKIENGNRTSTTSDKAQRDAEFADYISKKLANVGSGD